MKTKKEICNDNLDRCMADIRYYSMYPYSTLLGKWISKWILARLNKKLLKLMEELNDILKKERDIQKTINRKKEKNLLKIDTKKILKKPTLS